MMWKKTLKIAALIAAFSIVAMQFFQIDRTLPPIDPAHTLETAVGVPADISLILGRSCNDCHSHKTRYPWYSYAQPFGWFLGTHISDGRNELNFSEFGTYSRDKKRKKLEEICDQVSSGSMPLPSYLWIHRNAALSASERTALCDWASKELKRFETDN